MRTDLKEFKLISFNVRGINWENKQKIFYDLLKHNRPQMVCFKETKLLSPLYLDGSCSYQTLLQRNSGFWNASISNTKLQLMKALVTYFCWTELQLGNIYV